MLSPLPLTMRWGLSPLGLVTETPPTGSDSSSTILNSTGVAGSLTRYSELIGTSGRKVSTLGSNTLSLMVVMVSDVDAEPAGIVTLSGKAS